MAHRAALGDNLRAELTRVLRRLAVAGHIPDEGEREVRIRIKPDHSVAWIEPTRIRIPGSVLEQGFDETALGASST
jgi:hypothetical protein